MCVSECVCVSVCVCVCVCVSIYICSCFHCSIIVRKCLAEGLTTMPKREDRLKVHDHLPQKCLCYHMIVM